MGANLLNNFDISPFLNVQCYIWSQLVIVPAKSRKGVRAKFLRVAPRPHLEIPIAWIRIETGAFVWWTLRRISNLGRILQNLFNYLPQIGSASFLMAQHRLITWMHIMSTLASGAGKKNNDRPFKFIAICIFHHVKLCGSVLIIILRRWIFIRNYSQLLIHCAQQLFSS